MTGDRTEDRTGEAVRIMGRRDGLYGLAEPPGLAAPSASTGRRRSASQVARAAGSAIPAPTAPDAPGGAHAETVTTTSPAHVLTPSRAGGAVVRGRESAPLARSPSPSDVALSAAVRVRDNGHYRALTGLPD